MNLERETMDIWMNDRRLRAGERMLLIHSHRPGGADVARDGDQAVVCRPSKILGLHFRVGYRQ